MAEVKTRTVLWYLAFFGFAVNYMIRINLNITIVEMVASKGTPPSSAPLQAADALHTLTTANASDMIITSGSAIAGGQKGVPYNGSNERGASDNSSERLGSYDSKKLISWERQFLNWANLKYESEGFHWNEYEQGLVLGSYYWLHGILQIPGGILARKYGTKLVFGVANIIGCWCCFLMPILSYWNYKALIYIRVFQGVVTGLAWPAMHVLTAKWIPPDERSKFVTAYMGSSIGTAVFYPVFGYIMHWTSWEWVYHICGILGTVWYLAWLYFVYDSPAQHPRINKSELRYIEKSLGNTVQNNMQGPAPWRAILTSRPVWMNTIAECGSVWGFFTLMTQAPTYFRVIHHWNIQATGWLSGLPHVMRMLFAYVFSMFADHLLRTDRMSRTNVRKLATAVGCILKGVLVLALAFYGYNATAAIVLITTATMFHGAVSSGSLASVVDIAPNYAGIVLGIINMISGVPGLVSPFVVGLLTLGNQTIDAWRNVFLIAAAMLVGCGAIYVLFADSSLQFWNDNNRKLGVNWKEMQSPVHQSAEEEKEPLKTIDKHEINVR